MTEYTLGRPYFMSEIIHYIQERNLDPLIMIETFEAAYDDLVEEITDIRSSVSEAIRFQIDGDMDMFDPERNPEYDQYPWFKHGVEHLPDLIRRGEMNEGDMTWLRDSMKLGHVIQHPTIDRMYDELRRALITP